MVKVKIVICVVGVFSVFRELGIRANPNNGSTLDDGLCSELKEELESQVAETMRLQRLESDQKVENIRLRHNMLRNKDRKIKKLKNKRGRLTRTNALGNERRQLMTTSALGNERRRLMTISALGNERRRLMTTSDLGNQRRRLTTTQALQNERTTRGPQGARPVTATFIHSLTAGTNANGITKVEDRIFLYHDYPSAVKVFEDGIGFRFIRKIALRAAVNFRDIVYSSESKCVYMTDSYYKCIWMMTTTGDYRMTKWLTNITRPNTIGLSKEGHLLVLRGGEPFSQLEIYSLNAALVRSLQLPQEIKVPQHVAETSTGNFIILHTQNIGTDESWAISQLSSDGHVINRFIPRNQWEKLKRPEHLALDSDNNRLFVVDDNRVILFDSSVLSWSQVLLTYAVTKRNYPDRLFYDASKKHLFVARLNDNAKVYRIN